MILWINPVWNNSNHEADAIMRKNKLFFCTCMTENHQILWSLYILKTEIESDIDSKCLSVNYNCLCLLNEACIRVSKCTTMMPIKSMVPPFKTSFYPFDIKEIKTNKVTVKFIFNNQKDCLKIIHEQWQEQSLIFIMKLNFQFQTSSFSIAKEGNLLVSLCVILENFYLMRTRES